jgi:hypothetical protein
MMKHTELPWKFTAMPNSLKFYVKGPDSQPVALTEKDDAGFIVAACNVHYHMVDLLSKMAAIVESTLIEKDN